MNVFICRYCHTEKELTCDNFKVERRTHLGFDTVCKPCRRLERNQHRQQHRIRFLEKEKEYRASEKYQKYQTTYQEKNKEDLYEKNRNRYHANPLPSLQRSKEQKARDPVGYKKYLKKWRTENRAYLNELMKQRLRTDPKFKLRHRLRGALRKALKLQGGQKKGSILKYIGCSLDFLHGYLESQFSKGMTWKNHGLIWHVDHILPCASFNLLNEAEIYKCFHYSNLQPLLIIDNLRKGAMLPNGTTARKGLTKPHFSV